MSDIVEQNQKTGFEIAVIGMAGRFPGAKNIDEFWVNLKNGVESISFLTEEEIKEAGVDVQLLNNPHYVRSNGGVLENKECFDAAFFGFAPIEAEIMDPQMRILHEVAWAALEHAGYNPENYQGFIGFYAGASENFQWKTLTTFSEKSNDLGVFAVAQLVDRSFVCTRISYKFNLKGPSVSVQTACSTSLVAIHMACRAILSGECNMALAGGVSLGTVPKSGYLFQEGIILSPDGHCRAFDADAKGTVGGEGAGVVVLKLLEDAIADGDYIHAVIKSTAINNDGTSKVGFSAPSVEGQAEVIYAALVMAEIEPESIGYIEAHGTGTMLGDPVEVEALKLAFNTSKKGFCGLGSVKSNIGHLDTAAGVAGFIKTVLALKHRQIPPSLHFKTPNPKINFEESPFYVVRELSEWKREGQPLRAGVSSFGIGGTNAHVILEEPPAIGQMHLPTVMGKEKGEWRREYQLILLSAKTQTALDKMTENLVNHLKDNLLDPIHPVNPGNPGFTLADAAYTLQVGRKAFGYRKMVVCSDSDVNEAIDGLSSPDSKNVRSFIAKGENKLAAFMFPGQGAQYVNMGLGIYKTEPVFQEEMDRCFEILKPLMGYDIKEILYPPATVNSQLVTKPEKINQTEITQPVIFSFEYALATCLKKWGIKPCAMIGHSIGEYVAACLSGVFSLEDALKLVAARGKLMQNVSTGSMLSVPLSEEELNPLLKKGIALAAVNAPSLCVVSGTHQHIDEFAKQLEEKGYQTRKIHTSHAFHSKMMDAILEPFEEKVKQVKLNKPLEPYLSNLTGQWIQPQEAIDPAYWVKHLRHTVRFANGVEEMIKKEISVFIEVGPGKVLSTFVRQTAEKQKKENRLVVNLVRHPKEEVSDDRYLLDKVGQLWLYGTSIDWSTRYDGDQRHRLPLPTYPFEGERYWIDGDPFKSGQHRLLEKSGLQKKTDIADWFYVPVWKQSFTASSQTPIDKDALGHRWLLFMDECGLGIQLANRLEQEGMDVMVVRTGAAFTKENQRHYTINPANSHDYDALLEEVIAGNKTGKPLKFIHLWGVTGSESLCQESSLELELERMDEAQNRGIFSVIFLAQALGKRNVTNDIQIEVVTDNMQKVVGEERLCPEKAVVLGAVRVMAKEYPHLNCRSIDVKLPESPSRDFEILLDQLLEEWMTKSPGRIVAFRYHMRWVQTFEPLRLEEELNQISKLREQGVYLITGGLGGIGLELARYLAKSANARLVLTGRSSFPAREEWDQWLHTHDQINDVSQKIQKLQEIEALGGETRVFKADVSNVEQMQKVVDQTKACFGQINGVIHSAGLADYGGVIQRRSKEATEEILAAKVKGTLVLDRILKDAELDFFILCSSVASVFAPFGEVGYTAANTFLDAFAHYHNFLEGASNSRTANTISINWSAWKETGMTVEAKKRMVGRWETDLDEGILSTEGVEAFRRIIGSNLPQVGVFSRDLSLLLKRLNKQKQENEALGVTECAVEKVSPKTWGQRPELSTSYVAPQNEIEQTLAYIWQGFLGFEQIGIHDDFFELGGDSLKAVALIAKIHKELNLSLTLSKFFNLPTIKELAEYEYEHRSGINESIEENGYLSIEKTEEKEFYVLSPAQKRVYVLQQMEPQSIVYNMPEAVLIEGHFDKEKMASAFRGLIKRHESLRTAFEVIEENPAQKIYTDVEFEIEYDNGSLWSLEISPARIVQHFIRPFHLSHPPLLRVGFIKMAEKEHVLIADMHHIISDGFSLRILINEFISLYRGKTLPELKLQYKDFSQWLNKRLVSGEIKKQEDYWLREFKREIPVLKMPTDYKRPLIQNFEGNPIAFDFGKDGTEKLREFAKAEDVTLFILLFAIYNVFLYKISGQEDIVVGTVAAGRRHADMERIIGMFVNTMALRNYPKSNKRFNEFLKEVKERTLDAFDNQDYQFDDLVEKLLPNRDTSRNPLFDVLFTFISQEMLMVSDDPSGFGEPDLKIKKFEFETNKAMFDMILGVNDFGERLEFIILYSIKLFKKSTIERFMNYFKEIVFSVLENKFIPLKDISISYDLKVLKSDLYKIDESNFEF